MKFGGVAFEGKSGIVARVTDANNFCAIEANLVAMKREMVSVFNQQRALGLVRYDKDLEGFSNEPLLLLANHDPDKGTMRRVLSELPRIEHTELRAAIGSAMG